MEEGPLIRSTTTSKLSFDPGVMELGMGEEGRVVVAEPPPRVAARRGGEGGRAATS